MTPMQKAEVIEMIRETTDDVILAIGDGANDVAMIQVFFIVTNIHFFRDKWSKQNSRYDAIKFWSWEEYNISKNVF